MLVNRYSFDRNLLDLFHLQQVSEIPYSSVWLGIDPDLGDHPSLTNSISDLADHIGADHIIYRDSMRNWDGWSRRDGFYSLAVNGKTVDSSSKAVAVALCRVILPELWLSYFDRMLEMQNELNTKTAGAQWLERGLPWRRAIYMEAAEAIDSLPWKWWKSAEVDLDNLALELIDVWHFVLSWLIQEEGVSPKNLVRGAARLVYEDERSMSVLQGFVGGGGDLEQFKQVGIEKLESIIHACSNDAVKQAGNTNLVTHVAMHALALMMVLFPTKNMPAIYIAKNWLNEHRQQEGYNNPNMSYRKKVVMERGASSVEDNAYALMWVEANMDADKDEFFEAMRSAGFCGRGIPAKE